MVLFALVTANSSLALDITLAWDPSSSDVDGYRAFYREAGHMYDYSQPAWEGWETACTIYGLDEETTYYFVVRAYNELGESGNSNEASSSGDGFGPGTGIGTGVGTGAEAGGWNFRCYRANLTELTSVVPRSHTTESLLHP